LWCWWRSWRIRRDGFCVLISWRNVTTNRMKRGLFKRKLPLSSSHKHKPCTTLTFPLNSIFKLKKTLFIFNVFIACYLTFTPSVKKDTQPSLSNSEFNVTDIFLYKHFLHIVSVKETTITIFCTKNHHTEFEYLQPLVCSPCNAHTCGRAPCCLSPVNRRHFLFPFTSFRTGYGTPTFASERRTRWVLRVWLQVQCRL
jgi:hypothetical protein